MQGTPPDVDDALSLPVRLMPSCELLGQEAAVGFKDLYAIPNLQALGLPMSLVSLTGLISGPAAIILLPLLGWFSDSGTNTVRRRTYVLIITTLILISGILTVIVANSLPVRSCESGKDVSKPPLETSLGMGNSSISFDSNGSRLCENKGCNIDEVQSPDDLISLPTTISVTGQELGASSTRESSERVQSMPGSLGKTTYMTESSERLTFVTDSSEGETSMTESPETATSMTESSEIATSPTESSKRATLMTLSSESTLSTSESSERAISTSESSETATSTTESSKRATLMTLSSESTLSTSESSERAISTSEFSERAISTTESSKRATLMTLSSERAISTSESSERAISVTESSERAISTTESSKRATLMTLSSERAISTSESSERAISVTESSKRATSITESSEGATSMTETPENLSFVTKYVEGATFTTESSERATTTTESLERAISTTESSEETERATFMTSSSEGAITTTDSSARAISRTNSSERATSMTVSSERATSITETSEKSIPCSLAASGVAMFGYIMMEIGLQSLTSYIRTWMLMCSPPSAPTPTLVAGLVMTSLGGMLTSGLSMVDLASVFGLSSESRSGLSMQITIQAIAVVIPLVIGLILSLLIGLRQLKFLHSKHQHQHDQQQLNGAFIAQEHTISVNDLESSTGFQNHTESTESPTDSSDLGHAGTLDPLSKPISTSPTEAAQNISPELPQNFPDENQFTDNFSKDSTHSPSKPTTNYRAIEKETSLSNAATTSKNPSISDASGDCSSEEKLLRNESNRFHWPCHRPWGLRVTMAILICSAYFNFGGVTINKMTVSDFVGKAIFGGDPAAAPGTEDLESYQEGLRAASYGFLVYYACYLAFSFVQKPVLACMGYTVEFVTVTVAMALCLVLVSVTARLEMYFLLSAVSGVQRGVFNVVSVAIVSHLVHAEAKRRDDSKGPQLGLGVSAMFATLPLSYCTLYPWVGALAEVTGVPGAPLLLAAASSCVSAVLFCFVRV